jgi:hypothetical protein
MEISLSAMSTTIGAHTSLSGVENEPDDSVSPVLDGNTQGSARLQYLR